MSSRGVIALMSDIGAEAPAEVRTRLEKLLNDEMSLAEADGFDRADLGIAADHGFDLLDAGKIDDARAVFQTLANYEPSEPYFHLALGVVAQRDGKPLDAIGCFRRCLALDPENAYALTNLAECLLIVGASVARSEAAKGASMLEESIGCLTAVQGLDPNAASSAGQRARVISVAVRTASAA